MNELEMLSDNLRRAAHVAQNEPCWTLDDALAVVDGFLDNDVAILGVETWRFDNGDTEHPRVVDWSSYDVDVGLPWSQVLEQSGAQARKYLNAAATDEEFWFNFTIQQLYDRIG